jgi:hypothetical protein
MHNRYLDDVVFKDNPDPGVRASIWIDLCRESTPDQDTAIIRCQAFLRDYVTNARTSRPIFGPEETEEVRTVNSTVTVLKLWGCVVMEADARILAKKRREDPDYAYAWALRADMIAKGRPRGTPVITKINRVRFWPLTQPQMLGFTNASSSGSPRRLRKKKT